MLKFIARLFVPIYARICSFDPYANGRIAVYVTLYVYTVLSAFYIFNLNLTDNQAFFFVVPTMSAVGAAHANNIHTLQQRNNTYKMFLIFVAIAIAGFTLTEYSTSVILIFAFLYYIALMVFTSDPEYARYRGLIPPVFIISFLTILFGGVGQFYVAVNRVLSIAAAGLVGYLAIQLIASQVYHKIWYNSAFVVLSRINDQLKLIVNDHSSTIVFHGDCVSRMSNSLGFILHSSNEELFKHCSSLIYQFYFGIAYLYNSREYYADENYTAELSNSLNQALVFIQKKHAVPRTIRQHIAELEQELSDNEIKNIYCLLLGVIDDWEQLCQ